MEANRLLLRIEKETRLTCRKILEVGCADGTLLRQLAQEHHADGVGVDPYISERRDGSIIFKCLTAENIDTLDMRFGLVYTVLSLHHFSNPEKFIGNLKSMLAWNGRFIIVDWKYGTDTGVSEKYFQLSEVMEWIGNHDLRVVRKGKTKEHFYIVGALSESRIVVPTADGRTIFPKMLGKAPFFYVYQVFNEKKFQFFEKRINIYSETLQPQKTFDVYNEIMDCQAILSARIGKKGIARLKSKGVQLFFDSGDIENALSRLSPA